MSKRTRKPVMSEQFTLKATPSELHAFMLKQFTDLSRRLGTEVTMVTTIDASKGGPVGIGLQLSDEAIERMKVLYPDGLPTMPN